eukprot:1407602-Amphidinium_carterae.1
MFWRAFTLSIKDYARGCGSCTGRSSYAWRATLPEAAKEQWVRHVRGKISTHEQHWNRNACNWSSRPAHALKARAFMNKNTDP